MTKKILTLQDKQIPYTIKNNKRSKTITLHVADNGDIIATKPWYVVDMFVEVFIKKHEQWILKQRDHMQHKEQHQPYRGTKEEYKQYKQKARLHIATKVEYYCKIYNTQYSSISIRNQKTRWGSCSSEKKLNFNYRVLFLPEELQNYIIVHEVCHLCEMNHSREFWKLVEKQIPSYKRARKTIQQYNLAS